MLGIIALGLAFMDGFLTYDAFEGGEQTEGWLYLFAIFLWIICFVAWEATR